jgi:hypothetical protein
MKKLAIFLCIFSVHIFFAQTKNCDLKKISLAEKKGLTELFTHLKKFISTKDKQGLSSLISFPITCDYCQDKTNTSPSITISKSQFENNYYMIFFDPMLIQKLNSIQNIDTFTIMTPNDSGKCTFHFVYNFIEPSAKTEGRQHLFSLKKVKDKYHIVSVWTIP